VDPAVTAAAATVTRPTGRGRPQKAERWDERNARTLVYLDKRKRGPWRELAEAQGQSLSAVVNQLLDAWYQQHTGRS